MVEDECADSDLLRLWESFQPQVVAVTKVSPPRGSQELTLTNENSEKDSFLSPPSSPGERKEEEGEEEEEEQQTKEEEQAEAKEEEEEQKKRRKCGKKRVSFAPDDQLVHVHHLDDAEDVSIRRSVVRLVGRSASMEREIHRWGIWCKAIIKQVFRKGNWKITLALRGGRWWWWNDVEIAVD